jgi:hypothetical protein
MTLAKIVLRVGALVFAAIGIGFLVNPIEWAAVVDIPLPTATARTDLRATYGGFDLAIGVFLGWCALRTDWIRPGLAAMGLAAGFGGGRLLGILIEGSATPLMLGFAAIEAVAALVAFGLLRRLSHVPGGGGATGPAAPGG